MKGCAILINTKKKRKRKELQVLVDDEPRLYECKYFSVSGKTIYLSTL